MRNARLILALTLVMAVYPRLARARVIIQWFETEWQEVSDRAIELAMIGYDAVWLPPPQKGTDGVRDVGFSVYDRFDLGDVEQRGTTRTRYGTKEELVAMSATLHQLGARVIFDVVMNHNGNPQLIENAGVDLPLVGLDGFPDTEVLDYHQVPARAASGGCWEIRVPDEMGGGTMVMCPNTAIASEAQLLSVPMPAAIASLFPGFTHLVRAPRVTWDDGASAWEEMSYSLLGLADFAIDLDVPDTANPLVFNELNNATLPGVPHPSYIRQPDCPDCYAYTSGGTPVEETIIEYLLRWIVWLGEETDADGFRLDAVKHAPTDFFEAFHKALQDDYDLRRGASDTDHKDQIDDAQLFGESFTGQADQLWPYYQSGMQLLNFPLRFNMKDLLSSGTWGNGDLGQLSYPQGGDSGAYTEFGGLGRLSGVSFVQSHDEDPPTLQANLGYAYILTRVGDSVVFFDGNNPDARSFVKNGRPDALGDLDSDTITTLVYVANHFARGAMWNRFVDDDAYVYERTTADCSTPPCATLLAVLHDNMDHGDSRVNAATGVAGFGEFDPRPLLVSAFPPGTVLVDITGNSPLHETTVLDPAAVPASARDRALAEYDRSSDFGVPSNYGLVYLSVPSGPDKNYAMYVPRTPAGPSNGARALAVLQGGQRVPDVVITTAGEKRTGAGARVAAHELQVAHVTGNLVTLSLRTDGTAASAFVALDKGGVALGGRPLAGAMPDGAFAGFVEMAAAGTAGESDKLWEVANVDVSGLSEGVHLFRAGAARVAESGALVWTTFNAPVVIDRGGGGLPPLDPPDRDGDGYDNADDVCPDLYNPEQTDFDGDGVGDLCDYCPDDGPAAMLDADGCIAIEQDDYDAVALLAASVAVDDAALAALVALIDEVNP